MTSFVEETDCLLMLGCFLSDINLGIFTANLDPSRCINATSEDLQIRYHHYQDVRLEDFMRGLRNRKLKTRKRTIPARPSELSARWQARPEAAMTTARMFERLNRLLDEQMMVIVDVGDSLFGASDLVISRRTEFLGPAYYTSMGFAIPATVGASMGSPNLRPLVLVGDGSFQMTGMELSTIARHGLNPIIVVMNNKGYTTERFLLEGSFNDILNWQYHRIPQVLGTGMGLEVRTEGEFDQALEQRAGKHKLFQSPERASRAARSQPGAGAINPTTGGTGLKGKRPRLASPRERDEAAHGLRRRCRTAASQQERTLDGT